MATCRASQMWSPAAGAPRRLHRVPLLPTGPGGKLAIRRQQHPRTGNRNTAVSSFFGVGAPEAALVGIVAVVVFGPQGLIDAAKAAAATIRSFQPAIQEINQASSEIRTTITNEMGIDKLQEEFREISQTTRDSLTLNPTLSATAAANQPGTASASTSATSTSATASTDKPAAKTEVMDTIPQELESFESQVAKAQKSAVEEDPDIERKRAESAKMAWGGADAVPSPPESTPAPADTGGPRKLEDMSMAELERELERRKKLIKAIEDLNASA